jgi:hypothetical protein
VSVITCWHVGNNWEPIYNETVSQADIRLLADTACIAHPAVNFHLWLCLTLGRKAIHEVADL